MTNKIDKAVRATIMEAYSVNGDEQSNKNLEIMVDCYFEETPYWKQHIDDFANYASDEKNLDKFIARGAKIL